MKQSVPGTNNSIACGIIIGVTTHESRAVNASRLRQHKSVLLKKGVTEPETKTRMTHAGNSHVWNQSKYTTVPAYRCD